MQVDVVAAVIGKPSKKTLMRAVTCLGHSVNLRAPLKPTSENLEIVKKEYQARQLEYVAQVLRDEVIWEFGTLKNARDSGDELLIVYEEISKRGVRKIVEREAIKRIRNEFFRNISSIEIDNQLYNSKSPYLDQLEEDLDNSLHSEGILAERELVTALLNDDLYPSCYNSLQFAKVPNPTGCFLLQSFLRKRSLLMPVENNFVPLFKPACEQLIGCSNIILECPNAKTSKRPANILVRADALYCWRIIAAHGSGVHKHNVV